MPHTRLFISFTIHQRLLFLGVTIYKYGNSRVITSKLKVTPDKAKTKDTRKVNAPAQHVKVVPVVTPVKTSKPLGPKQVWVPKKK